MEPEKYKALQQKLRDGKLTKANGETAEPEPKQDAFAYINAAWECAPQFRDSHIHMQVLMYLAKCAKYQTGIAFPGYETIMHFAGTTNRNIVADALTRFVLLGILTKRKRLNNSTVYTLNLPRMQQLRKPFLQDFEAEVIDRVNNLVIQPSDKDSRLTHDIILAMNDDKHIYEILNWYLGLWEVGKHHEAHPSVNVKGAWGQWLDFFQGIFRKDGDIGGYREIRSSYFAMTGKEEPKLDWPTSFADDPEVYITFWHGADCKYCGVSHLGGCSSVRLKEIKDIERCADCNCLMIPGEEYEHKCPTTQAKEVKAIIKVAPPAVNAVAKNTIKPKVSNYGVPVCPHCDMELEQVFDIFACPTPTCKYTCDPRQPYEEQKDGKESMNGAKACDDVDTRDEPIKAPVPPASVKAPASIPAPFNNAPAPSVPVQPEIIKTFLCNICRKRVEYPHTHCPAALKADSEARAAEKAAKQDECAQRLKCEVRKNKPQIEATEEFSAYYFGEYFGNDDDEYMVEPTDEDERMELERGWQDDFASYFTTTNAKTLSKFKQLIELAKEDSDFTRLIRNQIASTAATLFLKYMDNIRKDDPNDDLGEVETESEDEPDSGEETFDLNEC